MHIEMDEQKWDDWVKQIRRGCDGHCALDECVCDAKVQVRSEDTGIRTFRTVKEALEYAHTDQTAWKISFEAVDGSRVRLIRQNMFQWYYSPLEMENPR